MNINILIVDDIEENIYVLESLFESIKDSISGELNLISAISGQEALEKALQYDIDLILLDIQMSDMDGFEVAKFLKKNSKTKNVPIIFLTAFYQEDEYIKNGFDVGAINYITKPIDKNIFGKQITNYIDTIHSYKKQQHKIKTENLELKNNYIKELELSKDKILVMLTHELKTPLNGIIGFSNHIARLLSKQDVLKSKETCIELANNINSMGKMLLSNVNVLLDISKLQQGKLVFSYQSIKAKELINQEIEIFDVVYDTKEIFSYLQDIEIVCDKQMLKHLFSNLISNALKYSYTKVHITLKKIDDLYFEFTVEDDGDGVDEKIKNKIFELFNQGEEKVFTREVEGTGIGLFLVHKLCEAFKYDIIVDKSSTLGGAKFVIKGKLWM